MSAVVSTDVLRASGIQVRFQGVKALEDVEIELERGEILGLIGPNGAGKTTLVNVLSGYQRPTAGRVLIDDVDVTRMPPHRRVSLGLVRTFQNVRIFPRLTVLDNVRLGAFAAGADRRTSRDLAMSLLERVGLGDRAHQAAGALPYGAERRLGIVRALAARPRFLLLDEPAAGLNDRETDTLIASLRVLPEEHDLGMLVIEHDMRVIMGLSRRIHVLDHGKTLSIGTPEVVRQDRAVHRAYFGRAVEVDDVDGQ
jgi:branched-chain amino acid transport system ATP-binding protein